MGKFVIGDQPKGLPKPIQFILSKFGGSQREEDKLAGYLSFLKVGPKLLKFIPVGKVQDLRNWLIIYALPELDGAIDPVPLGGLVGDDIYLVPERLQLGRYGRL